jgi:thiamine pyrophosphokinase
MNQDWVAIIANGELEQRLIEKIKKYPKIISVDGGTNHCIKFGINPDHIVGDLDSIKKKILLHHFPTARIKELKSRAKDKTDLEAGLEIANISKVDRVTVFGGLGNRFDHSLGNIILLFRKRHIGKLFLETSRETLFAIGPKNKHFELKCSPNQILTLIPMNGTVKDVRIAGDQHAPYHIPILDDKRNTYTVEKLGNQLSISVGSGEVLCILGYKEKKRKRLKNEGTIKSSFRMNQTFAETLRTIRHLCRYTQAFVQTDNGELICALKEKTQWPIPPKYHKPIKRGTTLSILPFNGAAKAELRGLKWQGDITFNPERLGISNVVMTPSFSINVLSGVIICVINLTINDLKILSIRDRTSTRRYDSTSTGHLM